MASATFLRQTYRINHVWLFSMRTCGYFRCALTVNTPPVREALRLVRACWCFSSHSLPCLRALPRSESWAFCWRCLVFPHDGKWIADIEWAI